MALKTFSRLCANRTVFHLGSLLLKACIFLPLPLLGQNRAVATATIPFAFSTGNHTLPAGDYVVSRVTDFTYSLRSSEGTAVQYVSVYHDSTTKAPAQSKLVFRSYGSRFFLVNLWFSGSRDGLKVRTGSAEKELLASHGAANPSGVLMAVDMGAAPQR